MKTFRITIGTEKIIRAESQDEAVNQFMEEIENEPQQTFMTYLSENAQAEEVKHCLDCGITLSHDEEIEDGRCLQCEAINNKQ